MAKKVSPKENILSRSFGFDPAESRHHFLLNIPKGSTQPIQISEHFTWDEAKGSSSLTLGTGTDGQIKVNLARPKWDAIADEVRAEFNQRLRRLGMRTGLWHVGLSPIRRDLGKELVLLTWAIEDADPALIPVALANWKGLHPEERWWLYTQTAAATGHGVNDRGKGWRKAVRFALTENPVAARPPDQPVVPEFFRRADQSTLFDGPLTDPGDEGSA
jgi:hypothetical protein